MTIILTRNCEPITLTFPGEGFDQVYEDLKEEMALTDRSGLFTIVTDESETSFRMEDVVLIRKDS